MEFLTQRPEAIKALEKISKDQGFQDYSITNVKTNAKGEGFIGDICFVTITDTKTTKSQELVLKLGINEESVRKIAPIHECFENEVTFYTEILPEYQKLLDEIKIEKIFTPKCFYTSMQNNHEVIAFENLKTIGFELIDKKTALDHDHFKLIFETYGKLHGLSYVLQKLKPEDYQRVCNNLRDNLSLMEALLTPSFVQIGALVKNSLIPGEDDEIIETYTRFLERDAFQIFKESLGESRYSVILHGDCWSNNMMFKYQISGTSKKLIDLRLLDFQIVKTGSPVCDLSYCLYSGGSKEVFDRLEDYLRIYHQSCCQLLKQFHLNIDEILPFQGLIDDWKKFAKFGYMMSLMILQMKFTNTEDIVDLKEMDGIDIDNYDFKHDTEKFNKRIREVLKNLFEFGGLK